VLGVKEKEKKLGIQTTRVNGGDRGERELGDIRIPKQQKVCRSGVAFPFGPRRELGTMSVAGRGCMEESLIDGVGAIYRAWNQFV